MKNKRTNKATKKSSFGFAKGSKERKKLIDIFKKNNSNKSNLEKYFDGLDEINNNRPNQDVVGAAARETLIKILKTIKEKFKKPVPINIDIFGPLGLKDSIVNVRNEIHDFNLIENKKIYENFINYQKSRVASQNIRTLNNDIKIVEIFEDKIKNNNQQIIGKKGKLIDPIIVREHLVKSWEKVIGDKVITSSAEAQKLGLKNTKNQWRRFLTRLSENYPKYKNIPYSIPK